MSSKSQALPDLSYYNPSDHLGVNNACRLYNRFAWFGFARKVAKTADFTGKMDLTGKAAWFR
jgi:hypothetical protein